MSNNAIIKEEQGDYQEARAFCRHGISVGRELNDRRTLLQLVEQWAGLNDLEGDHAGAARLMGAVEALHEAIAAPIDPLNRSGHERRVARLHANMGETDFAAAWADGRLMTLKQAIEYALSE